MTQEQLGKEIHVSRKTISSWENNRSIPSNQIIIQLEEILKSPILNKNVSNFNDKKLTFNDVILILSCVCVILSAINTASNFIPYWIVLIQIIDDVWIFNTFGKRIIECINENKLMILLLIFIFISLFLSQLYNALNTNYIKMNELNLWIIIAMIIHNTIVTYGLLPFFFFNKLFKYRDGLK